MVTGAVPSAHATGVSIQDGFNGSVMDTVTYDGIRYVAGTFTAWGPQTGGGALVDTDSGVLDRTFVSFENEVLASASDGSGGIFVAGYFRQVGTHRTGIAHILADGSVDSDFTAFADDGVRTLTVSGNTLYAGGDFTCINSVQVPEDFCAGPGDTARNRIAAFAIDTADLLAWNPNINDTVNAIAVSGSSVFVGGDFDAIGTTNVDRLAQVDAVTGVATSWSPNPNSTVSALVVAGGVLYVGGAFTSPRNRLAAYDASNGAITSWNPNVNGPVLAIAVSGGSVYVGGSFWSVGADNRNNLAALSATTGVATPWVADANGPVEAIEVVGSVVYVTGNFQFVGASPPTPRRGAAAVSTASDAAVLDWNPNPNTDGTPATVEAMVDGIFLGGDFTTVNNWQARSNLASLSAVGSLTSWAPSLNGQALGLMVIGSRLYVLGGFTTAQSTTRRGMAAYDLTTGGLTSWNPNPNDGGNSVELSDWDTTDGVIFVSGYFTSIGGATRPGLAAVDATTGLATSWNPAAPVALGSVYDIEVEGDRVYVGGGFTAIGSDPRHLIAALDRTTAATLPWDPQLDGVNISQIGIVGSTVVFGGRVTCMATNTYSGPCNAAGEVPLDGMGGADAVTGAPVPGWIHELNVSSNDQGYPRTILTDTGTTYLGGGFTVLDGQPVGNMAAFTSAGAVITGWGPQADDEVSSLELAGSSLIAAGAFSSINGSTPKFLQTIGTYSAPAPAPSPGGGGSNAAPTPSASPTASPSSVDESVTATTPTPAAPSRLPSTSRRRLGGGVTVITGEAARRTRAIQACGAPGRTVDSASVTYERSGEIIKLRTRGVTSSSELAVRILVNGSWSAMGTVTSNASGAVTLPAFTARRAGSYPLRLSTQTGGRFYTTVTTGVAPRRSCPA